MTDKEHLDAALERLSKALRELQEVNEGRNRLQRYYSEAQASLSEIRSAIIHHLDPYVGDTYADAVKAAGETLERQAELIKSLREESKLLRNEIDDLKERNDNQAEMIDAIASERDEAEEELARLKQPGSLLIGCPPGYRIAEIRYEPV